MATFLVGILNVTPDSFSDGGRYFDSRDAVSQAEALFAQGAHIVDIGAEATNPKAPSITAEVEWQRLEPIISKLLPSRPDYCFSIDTRHPETVETAAQYGKFYVNDVTTFSNPEMIAVTAKHGLKAIVSHLPLQTAGDISRAHHDYAIDDAGQVFSELQDQRQKLVAAGIPNDAIILDPGIGFGKSMPLNWQLLEFPGHAGLQNPVMLGFSRKRFLATDPLSGELIEGQHRLSPAANLAAARIAIASAQKLKYDLFLRVHEPVLYHELVAA